MRKRRSRAPDSAEGLLPPSNLRSRSWRRFLRGPDQQLLEELYVPALTHAVRYDRCCAYFSSSVLSAAARGFGKLIERLNAMGDDAPHPAVRLVVNEELAREDVRALVETDDTTALEKVLARRLKTPTQLLEKQRLQMLGWLAKHGLLEVRVGVMRFGTGIVHAKFGVMTDEQGDAVVFNGSGNESAQGLAANYERLDVSTSWDDSECYAEYAGEFEALWTDGHPTVHTVKLPEAIRLKLVRLAPPEPPVSEPSTALERQKTAMIWRFIVEAPYLPTGATACDATAMVDLWPHQQRVVEEVADAWPSGRLLCDEVGMGKTIEATMVLRRLMAGRGVGRALILVPAGLTRQWQAELREKGGLVFPRLDGSDTLVWPDERKQRTGGLAAALGEPFLVMSRETARTPDNRRVLLEASPWDLVMLDEAHAARRRNQIEGEFNAGTLLLDLVRQLQLQRKARGILLLSATPMQTHPWEPWDLLSVLGEGGPWLAEFSTVREYYAAIRGLEQGRLTHDGARRAAAVMVADPEFPRPLPGSCAGGSTEAVARGLVFAKQSQRPELAQQLRRGSPLSRRMHRNGRQTLREYWRLGLLENPPPGRSVTDLRFDYRDRAERQVYRAVTKYIDKRYDELESERRGKGFVMTVYRRRAASSPLAIERSLERRAQGLRSVIQRRAFDGDLSYRDTPDLLDDDDLPEVDVAGKVSAAFPTSPRVAQAELSEVSSVLDLVRSLRGVDTKLERLYEVLGELTAEGRRVLVFTQYADTVEYLRDRLVGHYDERLGCYTGAGGEKWSGGAWSAVTKSAISSSLQRGELELLVCTDAASEGLNLQAASAVVNYDLPWNPSRVEQRIGRVDRIGQAADTVRVVNLFIADSVDDQVYTALRGRCGLFEHFVGPMQPVLAEARRMLTGQVALDPAALHRAADAVDRELLASAVYAQSPAMQVKREQPALGREDMAWALSLLPASSDITVRPGHTVGSYRVSGRGMGTAVWASDGTALESDASASPLSPLSPECAKLVESLGRAGERLPLVVGSAQEGPFRTAVVYWLQGRRRRLVRSLAELRELVAAWDGVYPAPDQWTAAMSAACAAARRAVNERRRIALDREAAALRCQVGAARHRLRRELGRYLVCLGAPPVGLNDSLREQLGRSDLAGGRRLREAFERLGGFPEWPEDVVRDLADFQSSLTENVRRARLAGSELDAALQDPRWTGL